jgi:glycosyltransferase involved in cell wall biosynthesis
MDLLFLNHNYRNQGTYYRAMPMAEQLANRGHQVTLLTVSPEHRWRTVHSEVGGVHLIETPGLGQGNSGGGYGPLDNGFRCLHALSHRYDIIHMFDHKPNATFAGFSGRLRGARLVADWADWWGGPGGINDVPSRRMPVIGRFETWWEEKSKLWADGVVTISTVLKERAIDLGCPSERVLYLPTGAATDRIQPMPVAQARRRLNIPADRSTMGFIGQGQGDLDQLMRAMQEIPNLWLMLIGHVSPEIFTMAESFGVADRLWQTGFVPDKHVGLYLACCDFMALPLSDRAANRGRLPNKLLDYMAAGRPVVASPIGDVKMILETYQVGLAVDGNSFADQAAKLLAESKLREELGTTARHVAETVFNWPGLIDKLERFYKSLL